MISKKAGSRLVSLLLAVLMLIAYMPLLGEAAYADDSVPVLETDKSVYAVGEDIYVTTTSIVSGGWIAVYEKDDPNAPDSDGKYGTSYYWYYPEKFGPVKVLDGVVSDTNNENWGSTAASERGFAAGDYQIVYLDSTYHRVGDPVYFSITNDITNYVKLDKPVYEMGEPIMVTAKSSNASSNAWVGLYKKDEATTGSPVSFYWYYVKDHSNTAVNILETESNGRDDFGPGEYKIVLYRDGGYNAEFTKNFTVTIPATTATATVSTDKEEYALNEEISITCATDDQEGWVAIYDADEESYGTSILWYYPDSRDNTPTTKKLIPDVGTLYGGRYKAVYLDKYYRALSEPAYFTIVNPRGLVSIDSTTVIDNFPQYKIGQDIIVSLNSDYADDFLAVAPNSWVGLYDWPDDPNNDPGIGNENCYFKVNCSDFVDGKTNILNGTPGGKEFNPSGTGHFRLVLFAGGNDVITNNIYRVGISHAYAPEWDWYEDDKVAVTFKAVDDPNLTTGDDIEPTIEKATTPATCEAAGKIVYTATVTADQIDFLTEGEAPFTSTNEVPIEAIGHDYNAPTYTWADDGSKCTATATCKNDATHVVTEEVASTSVVKTPATCVAKGTTTYTATFTNALFTEQTKDIEDIDALGHTMTTHDAVEATCTEGGSNAYSECSVCGKFFSDEAGENEIEKDSWKTEALGHTPGEAVEENKVDSTCSKEGSYDEVVYCSVCHAEISRTQKTIAKKDHTEEVIPAKEATCTEAGLTEGKKCSVCGEVLVAQSEVAALGHDYKEVADSAKAPTFTEAGKEADKVCSRCGDKIVGAEIPKLTAEASLSKTKFHYNAKVQKPDVTVAVNGVALDPKDYDVTVPSSKKIGTYKVAVKTKGDYAGFETTLEYQIAPKKVALKPLTKGTKSFTAKWAKQSATARKNIGGFQLRYSKDKTFKTGVGYSKKFSNKATKWTKKGLKSKTKYYVQIRTFKKVNGKTYWSDWSAYRYVKTK